MCHSFFFLSFLIVYCPDKYITHKMRDETVGDPLAVLEKLYSQNFVLR